MLSPQSTDVVERIMTSLAREAVENACHRMQDYHVQVLSEGETARLRRLARIRGPKGELL